MDRREVPREGVPAKVRHQRAPAGADLFKISRMPDRYTVISRIVAPMSEVEPATDDPLIANRKTNRESYGQSTRQVQIA